MKRSALTLSFLALVACREHSHGEHSHAEHASHDPPKGKAASSPANPVQHEMRLLTAALEGAVRRIGERDVRGVEHDLHRVHAAKEATEAALREGRYRPPRNPDGLERFHELDEAFHRELERLVAASGQNDIEGTAKALGVVLQACEGCHSEFRP